MMISRPTFRLLACALPLSLVTGIYGIETITKDKYLATLCKVAAAATALLIISIAEVNLVIDFVGVSCLVIPILATALQNLPFANSCANLRLFTTYIDKICSVIVKVINFVFAMFGASVSVLTGEPLLVGTYLLLSGIHLFYLIYAI